MKSILNRIKKNYNEFMQCARKNDVKVGKIKYLKFVYYCTKYSISINDYFFNRLYDTSVSHKDFWSKNHKIIHRWKNVIKNHMPDVSLGWRMRHYIDYIFSRLLYPGLDAMDYIRYEFYNFKRSKRKTFITENSLRRMNKFFNDERKNMFEFRILQDKAKFNEHFSNVVSRKWIKTEGMSKEEFNKFCEGLDRVIAKPKDGSQGKGIFIVSITNEEEKDNLFEKLKTQDYLLEELIVQCDEIAKLNPRAVNSIRINSVLVNNEVVITSATLRLGSGKSDTDNYSAGGFAASIDVKTGIVISRAVSQHGLYTYSHPLTQEIIIGTQIPNWDKVLDTVKSSHRKISSLRYVGWDVVVCADGAVTFLEANTFAGVALQQHPLLEGKKPLYKRLKKELLLERKRQKTYESKLKK